MELQWCEQDSNSWVRAEHQAETEVPLAALRIRPRFQFALDPAPPSLRLVVHVIGQAN